jgi:hypothetical protein
MALPIEFQGLEYDWFAKDRQGNFALFATAGEGFMPEEVIANYWQHAKLLESIEEPHRGTPQVWEDYSSIGLYVFDWDLPGGPYYRAASPAVPIDQTLKNELLKIADMPTFDCSFAETAEIRQKEMGTRT